MNEMNVKTIAADLSIGLSDEEVEQIVREHDGYCEEDPSAAWYLVVEQQIYDLRGISKKKSEAKFESDKYVRPTWDEYFMEVCDAISKRATCDRGRSGCVIAKDNQLLVTGYVGSPAGLPHCDDVGHQMKSVIHEDGKKTDHCVRTVHAEQNAICQAAKQGISLNGATMYCRMTPCRVCAMLIINCGIKRVVAEKRYHAGQESIDMFATAGVVLEHIHDEVQTYPGEQKKDYK